MKTPTYFRLPLIVATFVLVTGNAAQAEDAAAAALTEKLQPYIACINRLSERSYDSRDRYFSWAGGKEKMNTKARIVYGLYEIYDTSDCASGVKAANDADPDNPELEAAGSEYVAAVTTLEPLLQTANSYYDQEDYKDDKMAKGKELHPQLLAAFASFEKADTDLRAVTEEINDGLQLARLAELEKTEGRSGAYLTEFMMTKAKGVLNLEMADDMAKIDLEKLKVALDEYDSAVQELEAYEKANSNQKFGPSVVDASQEYLKSAKQLMRRVRDKTKFSSSEVDFINSGGGWMVEGSQPRLVKDYNSLIDAYNRQ